MLSWVASPKDSSGLFVPLGSNLDRHQIRPFLWWCTIEISHALFYLEPLWMQTYVLVLTSFVKPEFFRCFDFFSIEVLLGTIFSGALFEVLPNFSGACNLHELGFFSLCFQHLCFFHLVTWTSSIFCSSSSVLLWVLITLIFTLPKSKQTLYPFELYLVY